MIKEFFKRLIYRIRGQYTVNQLRRLGLKVGKNFNPQLGFELDPSHCWLIEIGDNVTFGPHVQVLAHDASTCNLIGYAKIGKVKIGNNVFVGAGSIILPNITIGDNCVIGAGSVVSKSIPSNSVAVGNPARVVSSIEQFIEKNKERMTVSPVYNEEYTLRKGIDEAKKLQQSEQLNNTIGFLR